MNQGESKGGRGASAVLALLAALTLSGCVVESSDEAEAGEDVAAHSEPLVGNQYVTVESEYGHSSSRDVTAVCPVGKVVYGAGYSALLDTGGLAAGSLKHFAPSADGSSWTARVRVPVGYKGNWKLRLTATCASKLPGYQIKTSEAAHAIRRELTVKAECAAPQRVPTVRATGGGFASFNSSGTILEPTLNAMPATGLNWSVTAYNPTSAGATLRSYVVCVAASAVEEYAVVSASKAWPAAGTEEPQMVLATCAAGSWPLSAGFQLLDQDGDVMNATLRESRGTRKGSIYGWATSVYRQPPGEQPVQLATTLKQYLLCVKDQPN